MSASTRCAKRILTQVREVIVGQEEVLDQILIAIFVGGHCLLTGMPGTAKTLMVRTIADALGLQFRRIQFTPDLMPSDITGTDIIEEDLTTGLANGPLLKDRSSATSCSPMKSTALPQNAVRSA